TTDASPDGSASTYSGKQVAVAADGSFSFTISPPFTTSTPTITAVAVNGAQQKSTNSLLTFTQPPSQRYDFNFADASFPNGGVSPNNTSPLVFNSVTQKTAQVDGLGYYWVEPWVTPTYTGFDYGPNNGKVNTNLWRDGNYGSAPRTFRVTGLSTVAGAQYDVRVYIGGTLHTMPSVQVKLESGAFTTLVDNQFNAY